jgi:hypothetical protein
MLTNVALEEVKSACAISRVKTQHQSDTHVSDVLITVDYMFPKGARGGTIG